MKPWTLVQAMVLTIACAAGAHAAGVPSQGTWQTTLQPRDLDADGTVDAYYDTALGISWLDNFAADPDNPNGSAAREGFASFLDEAQAWAASLDVHGVTGWRLPRVAPVNGVAYQTTAGSSDGSTDVGAALAGVGWGEASELGHLYYVTLGNTFGSFSNNGPLSRNLFYAGDVWTESVALFPSLGLCCFSDNFILQQNGVQTNSDGVPALSAWAVHDGDVMAQAVPEPATVALLAAGLAAGALRLRRRAQ